VRAKQFLELYEAQQQLFEVEMSPSNLKKLASNINARAGIEFEMLVPDVEGGDDEDVEQEEDWNADVRANDIDDICNFFHDGAYNDRSGINDLREELEERFREWATEQQSELWDEDGKRELYYWIKNNVSDEDLAEYLEKEVNDEEYNPTSADYKEAADKSWDEQDSYYDDAYEEFISGYDNDNLSEKDFLRSIGIRDMSDVNYNNINTYVRWPHWIYPDSSGGNVSIDEVGESFREAIGKRVNLGSSYHSARRSSTAYSLEPDSSLEADDGYGGLEFISPPMPIDEMIEDIDKVKEWAKDYGCVTNSTCGLHMNVSVPDYSRDKLDYVKLALLSGDKYILDQFSRAANSYCKSALDIIQEKAKDERQVEQLLTKLRSNVEEIASKVIHSGRTDKYTSINTKDQYVEFRGPGNNWLETGTDKLTNTLLRFVVALDAACDPQKYRKEYLKALYKALPSSQKNEQMSLLAQYMAGDISKKRYADELMFKKADRMSKNGVIRLNDTQVDDGDWEVTYDDGEKQHTVYIKDTPQVNNGAEALKAAQVYEPKLFNKNTVQYVTVKRHSIDVDRELKEYQVEYNNKIILILAKSEEDARNIVKTIDAPFMNIRSDSVNMAITELDKTLSLRGTRDLLKRQNEKFAYGEDWLKRDKLFNFSSYRYDAAGNRFNAYIVAKSTDEAYDIVKRLNPAVNDDNTACGVHDHYPSAYEVEAYRRAQEDLIRQRQEQARPGETSDIKMYRVHNMNGYDYVMANSEEEASDIATRINFVKFPAGSVTVVKQELDPRHTEEFVRRQNERLAEAPKPYHIVDTRTNQPVEGSVFPVRSEHEALMKMRDYVNHGSHGMTPAEARDVFAVRPVSS
jgi:lipopolysaccharide export LptBFGC system permease protein LptF